MIFSTIPSLVDMCATSIVYKIWTRHNIYVQRNNPLHWKFLETKVTADLNHLPLPKLVKSNLLSFVKASGRHYYNFLSVWLTKLATSEEWLTEAILSDCLTLYPVGIINQRETAVKLLRSKVVDDVIAFRLACINFLDVEVLRLWPRVAKYFLNKIVLADRRYPSPVDPFTSKLYLHEPREVLFWIGYCLSVDTFPNPVPHFDGYPKDWFRDALSWAGTRGEAICFEFMKDAFPQIDFSHEIEMRRDCFPYNKNFLVYYFYHFSCLDSLRKKRLFNEKTAWMVCYFLQWPLSSLFLENSEAMCDVLKEHNLMDWLFVQILEILHGKRYLGHHWDFSSPERASLPSLVQLSDIYNKDHLERIWNVLWKMCPAEIRSRIVVAFAFTNDLDRFLEITSSEMTYDVSTLTNDLRELFLSNGQAFLLFLSESNLSDALEIVVSKYMPEKHLNFRCFQSHQFFNHPSYTTCIDDDEWPFRELRIVAGLHLPVDHRLSEITGGLPIMRLFEFSEIETHFKENFFKYIRGLDLYS